MSLPERITSLPVMLRPFTAADAPRLALLCGDWDVAQMTAVIPHPYTVKIAEEWIAGHAAERAAGIRWNYAVTRAGDGLLVGAIGVNASPGAVDSFGYWIGRPFWRLGYATAAGRAILAVVFARLEIDELHATHLTRNPASGRVMEKCGMTLVRREYKPHRGGPEEEFCLWSITRERWSERFGMP